MIVVVQFESEKAIPQNRALCQGHSTFREALLVLSSADVTPESKRHGA
ncbi:MAG TPA: hypothetical protein VF914_20685 [Chloroflexia bacterium]|jgi:hypothetical protein